MSKYTEELKKQIVLEHKIKHYGARVLQRKYGIPHSLIRQRIAQYELNGKFTEPARRFSGEFKLKVGKIAPNLLERDFSFLIYMTSH